MRPVKGFEQLIEAARKTMRPERVLLTGSLVLQVVVMAWLYQLHQTQKSVQQDLARLKNQVPLNVFPFGRQVQPAHKPLSNPYVFPADNVQAHFNRMMADAFNNFERMSSLINFDAGWDALQASPTMDMRELKDRYEIIYSLPGINRDALHVVLEGRLLTVSSSGQSSANSRNDYNHFESRVQIPGPVGDPKNAQADFTNGVLKVTVPRAGHNPEPAAQFTKLM
jgi:HSP20 family molecular chaperone IbpA